MENIRTAAVQFQPIPADKRANLATIQSFTEEAAAQNVKLVVFPECCITGYWFLRKLSREQISDIAEPACSGPSSRMLVDMARRHDLTIGAGLVEAGENGRFYNTYVVALPNGEIHRHRKLHAFENEHIASGNEYTVFDTPHGYRVGVLICYDVNLIENVRITALRGADVC